MAPGAVPNAVKKLDSQVAKVAITSRVKAPVASTVSITKSMPQLNTVYDSTFVKNIENIATISCGSSYTGTNLEAAPFEFPWLLGIAMSFSKFRWISLRIFYIPECSTTTAGITHMGLQYDHNDAAPASAATFSGLAGYTAGPVWSGYQAANALSSIGVNPSAGSIYISLDVTRGQEKWYPVMTAATFTAQASPVSVANSLSPARLVIGTTGGTPSTATPTGLLYAQYVCELIEPVTSSLND